MLLIYSFPRKDTKPIVKEMIRLLGSFKIALEVPIEDIFHITDLVKTPLIFFRLIKEVSVRYLIDSLKKDLLQMRSDSFCQRSEIAIN